MPTFQVLNGPTIPAGEALSDGLDCTAGTPVRITMPAVWGDGQDITFQVSTDNIGYNNLVRVDGSEVTAEVVPGSALLLPAEVANACAWLKIRSGPSAAPMVQNEQRTFAVSLRIETAPVVTQAKTKTTAKTTAKKRKR
jgi:hypothetical protein